VLTNVTVRWRTPVPGSGYDLWDGDGWLPISRAEYLSYLRCGLSVWLNPPWCGHKFAETQRSVA